MLMVLVATVSATCDPYLIRIEIYDDDKCSQINVPATRGSTISDDDAKVFNECNAVRAGSQTIYTKNVCDEFTFTIGMYSNAVCQKVLKLKGIQDKYVFDWGRCYRRSAT